MKINLFDVKKMKFKESDYLPYGVADVANKYSRRLDVLLGTTSGDPLTFSTTRIVGEVARTRYGFRSVENSGSRRGALADQAKTTFF